MFLPLWLHTVSICRGHRDPLAAEERRWVIAWGLVLSPPSHPCSILGISVGGTLGMWIPRWVSDPSLPLSFFHRGSLVALGTLEW